MSCVNDITGHEMTILHGSAEPILNPPNIDGTSPFASRRFQHTEGGGEVYLETLARTLFIGPRDDWAMLTAYFDESGTHDGAQIMVLAGLVSPVFQWERLTRSWERLLNQQGLTSFHAVDCAHGVGEFENLDHESRAALNRKLVGLMVRHVLWRTWTAIVVTDYLQCFKDPRRAHHLAYTVCASGCASRILQLAKLRDTRIPYVFERGGRGGKHAAYTFNALLKSGETDVYRMGALTVDSSRRLVPLQAADLHVYEVYKYFADQLAKKPRFRRSFAELLKIPEAGGGGYLYTAEKLQEWLRRMKAGERPIQIPVDPLNTQQMVVLRLNE